MDPRLWGRLVNPLLVRPVRLGARPGLILVLWATASGLYPPPAAYGKPAPVDPVYLKRPVGPGADGLAGPSTNVVLGVVAGIGLRLVASPGR
jgi:hypothetical protein